VTIQSVARALQILLLFSHRRPQMKAVLAFLDEVSLNAYLDRTKLVPFTPSTITTKKRLLEDLRGVR
jgi:hypothetical protein